MHFAASALVGESMTNPKKYFHNNFVNALKLADAAVECGVKKFVFSSTCATYGPPDQSADDGRFAAAPDQSLRRGETDVRESPDLVSQIYKLEFIAFRYFNAAGASEKFGEHHRIETHLIPNVLFVALGQKPHVRNFRHGLSDARRHLHPRLHPHQGSGAGAHSRIAAGQNRIFQSGQWRRLFREASDFDVRKSHRQKNSGD